jgi:hypothetical protein
MKNDTQTKEYDLMRGESFDSAHKNTILGFESKGWKVVQFNKKNGENPYRMHQLHHPEHGTVQIMTIPVQGRKYKQEIKRQTMKADVQEAAVHPDRVALLKKMHDHAHQVTRDIAYDLADVGFTSAREERAARAGHVADSIHDEFHKDAHYKSGDGGKIARKVSNEYETLGDYETAKRQREAERRREKAKSKPPKPSKPYLSPEEIQREKIKKQEIAKGFTPTGRPSVKAVSSLKEGRELTAQEKFSEFSGMAKYHGKKAAHHKSMIRQTSGNQRKIHQGLANEHGMYAQQYRDRANNIIGKTVYSQANESVNTVFGHNPFRDYARRDVNESFIDAREYAAQGKIHPEHAKRSSLQPKPKRPGYAQEYVDWYEPKTANKVYGFVTHNDGKTVRFKVGNQVHQYEVSDKLEPK